MAAGVLDVGELIETRPIGRMQWIVIGLCALVAMLDGLDLQSIGLARISHRARLSAAAVDFSRATTSARHLGMTFRPLRRVVRGSSGS